MANQRELTVDELDIDGMVYNMHFRLGEACAATPADLAQRLWELFPFLKALGRLAAESPERTRELWAEALKEPMPFGVPAPGMPRVEG